LTVIFFYFGYKNGGKVTKKNRTPKIIYNLLPETQLRKTSKLLRLVFTY